MLKALRDWVLDKDQDERPRQPDVPAPESPQADGLSEKDARLSFRHDFSGHRIVIRSRRTLALLHLKELSCLDASGLTDLPVAVGAIVFVTLTKRRYHAAEVSWVKNVMVGLRFFRPLDPDKLERIHAAHIARRSAGYNPDPEYLIP